MTMNTHVAPEPNVPVPAVAPEANAAPAARKKAGRPPKYVVPTDGSPLTPKMQAVLRDRERKRIAYQANPEPEQICARNYRSFKFAARQAKQRDTLRQLEELKRVLAALVAGEPVVRAAAAAAAGG